MKSLLSLKGTLYAILVPPLFFFLFWYAYAPFVGSESSLLSERWEEHSLFCIAIISAILLLVGAVSRVLLFFRHKDDEGLGGGRYLLWQLGEFVAAVCFVDLFVCLFFQATYARYLFTITIYGALTLLIPYLFMWLVGQLVDARGQLALLEERAQKEEDPIRFMDEKGVVRLVLAASKVITLESAGNYVDILYDDNGRAARFSLRNTLKEIEPLCTQHGLVRCHRSFFLNLNKVKVLRRTNDGVLAEIDFPGVDDVPVTKSYVGEVFKRFNA